MGSVRAAGVMGDSVYELLAYFQLGGELKQIFIDPILHKFALLEPSNQIRPLTDRELVWALSRDKNEILNSYSSAVSAVAMLEQVEARLKRGTVLELLSKVMDVALNYWNKRPQITTTGLIQELLKEFRAVEKGAGEELKVVEKLVNIEPKEEVTDKVIDAWKEEMREKVKQELKKELLDNITKALDIYGQRSATPATVTPTKPPLVRQGSSFKRRVFSELQKAQLIEECTAKFVPKADQVFKENSVSGKLHKMITKFNSEEYETPINEKSFTAFFMDFQDIQLVFTPDAIKKPHTELVDIADTNISVYKSPLFILEVMMMYVNFITEGSYVINLQNPAIINLIRDSFLYLAVKNIDSLLEIVFNNPKIHPELCNVLIRQLKFAQDNSIAISTIAFLKIFTACKQNNWILSEFETFVTVWINHDHTSNKITDFREWLEKAKRSLEQV